MTYDHYICWCRWCRPGWRKSKRDAHIEIVRIGELVKGIEIPPTFESPPVVIFLKRER